MKYFLCLVGSDASNYVRTSWLLIGRFLLHWDVIEIISRNSSPRYLSLCPLVQLCLYAKLIFAAFIPALDAFPKSTSKSGKMLILNSECFCSTERYKLNAVLVVGLCLDLNIQTQIHD